MATIFGTNGNNTLIVEADDLLGLAGNDTYIVTNNLANNPANGNRTIVVTDTEGNNRLQLADGLQINEVRFLGGNAVQLTLSNNLRIQVVGADRFTFDIGLNAAAGDTQGLTGRTFTQFAADLGVVLNAGAGVTTAPITIQAGANPVPPAGNPGGGGGGNAGSYTLTSGADNVTAQTVGNSVGTGAFGTLNTNDRVVDASTTDADSLSVELLGNLDSSVTLTNIESLLFNVLAGTSTLDATNYTGVKLVEQRGAGNLSLTNLSTLDTTYKLNGTASNLSLSVAGGVAAGGNDGVSVELSKVTGGRIDVGANIETLSLKTTAGEANTLAVVTGNQLSTVVVTGGGQLTLGALGAPGLPTGVTTLDARGTSKATVFAAGSATTAILTGEGADDITYQSGLEASNFISGGGGVDILTLTAAANNPAVGAATLIGVENIRLNAASSAINLLNTTGPVALDFRNGGTLTVANATAGTTVRTSTNGSTLAVDVGYQNSVQNQVLDLDLSRTLSGGTVTLTNVADARLSVGAIGPNTVGAITLDETIADGSAATSRFTVETVTAGAVVTLGAIGGASLLNDYSVLASGGAVTVGALDDADALTNLAVVASGGNITLGAIGGGVDGQSLQLNTVVVDVRAGYTLTAAAAVDVLASNAAGVSVVSLSAGGDIGAPGANNGLALSNTTGGFGTLFVSGTADVYAALTAGDGRVAAVTSNATGSVNLTVTNNLVENAPGTLVTLGNAAANRVNTITLASSGRDTVMGGSGRDVVATGAGDDVISVGIGEDRLTGGAGADSMTGGANNDVFVFGSASDTRNVGNFAGNNTTAANIDRITDFNGNGANAGDVIQLSTAANAFGAALTFTANTTATVLGVSIGTVNAINNFTDFAAAITGGVASTAANARVYDVTVTQGSLTGRYFVLNDNVAAITLDDAIVTITGVTGALHASDFVFA